MPFERKKILVLVKTYPNPSTQYRETVCTAGITDNNQWIRLYPIPYRELESNNRYKLFQWIDVEVEKSNKDHRPESYRINSDSLLTAQFLDPKKDIQKRVETLQRVALDSYADAIKLRDERNISLAAFIPKEITDISIKATEREWTERELTKLMQMSLFDYSDASSPTKAILEKIPYEFRIQFTCNEPNCPGHDLMITEWEIMQTYRNFRKMYGSEKKAIEMLKQKYMEMYSDPRYQRYLIVGTVHVYKHFINIGHYAYLRSNYNEASMQPTLFDFL